MQVGKQKSRFLTNIWFIRILSTVRPLSVIHTAAPDRSKLLTLIAGIAISGIVCCSRETDDEVFNKPQRYAEDNRTSFNYAVVKLKPK